MKSEKPNKQPKKIADNPGFSESRSLLHSLELAANGVKLLKGLGIPLPDLDKHIPEVSKMKQEHERLSSLPDRFDALFAEKGWIAHESMNVLNMEAAIELANQGNLLEAEETLCNHFDYEEVRLMLLRMTSIDAFRPRSALADIALNEYKAENYFTCVPLVLMLMDGLVTFPLD